MKTLKILLTMTLLLAAMVGFGQDYAFKVMAHAGANQLNSGSGWTNLKTGSKLNNADQLKVASGGYIGLLHAGGKTLEVKEAGTYKISDLVKKVPQGKSVAGKYADFLQSKMTAEAKKNRLNATGSVTRDISGGVSIDVFLPENVDIYNEVATIRWEPLESDDITYKIQLMSMFEEVLISQETTDTFYELNFNDKKLENENIVLLVVSTSEDEEIKSATFPVKKLPPAEKQQIKSDLSELMSDVNDQTALNKYILAGFYEENNLLVDALTMYEDAMELAPEVETFKEAYEDFLIRNGLRNN